MRRAILTTLAALAPCSLLPPAAQAAAPTAGPVSATNIQGVSALVKGDGRPGRGWRRPTPSNTSTTPASEPAASTAQPKPRRPRPGRATARSPPAPRSPASAPTRPTTCRLAATNSSGSASSEATFDHQRRLRLPARRRRLRRRKRSPTAAPLDQRRRLPSLPGERQLRPATGRRIRGPAGRGLPRRRPPRPRRRSSAGLILNPAVLPLLLRRRLLDPAHLALRTLTGGRELPDA